MSPFIFWVYCLVLVYGFVVVSTEFHLTYAVSFFFFFFSCLSATMYATSIMTRNSSKRCSPVRAFQVYELGLMCGWICVGVGLVSTQIQIIVWGHTELSTVHVVRCIAFSCVSFDWLRSSSVHKRAPGGLHVWCEELAIFRHQILCRGKLHLRWLEANRVTIPVHFLLRNKSVATVRGPLRRILSCDHGWINPAPAKFSERRNAVGPQIAQPLQR